MMKKREMLCPWVLLFVSDRLDPIEPVHEDPIDPLKKKEMRMDGR